MTELQMISKYISYAEATKTKHRGIPNQPNAEQLHNIKYLCVNILDKVREHFNSPIVINSLFRSKAVNDITPGSSDTSQHMCNCDSAAADIGSCGSSLIEVYEFIKNNLEFDQLIKEFPDKNGIPSWIHVSTKKKGKLRKQILTAKKINGKTVYENG